MVISHHFRGLSIEDTGIVVDTGLDNGIRSWALTASGGMFFIPSLSIFIGLA